MAVAQEDAARPRSMSCAVTASMATRQGSGDLTAYLAGDLLDEVKFSGCCPRTSS
jgi:hypothetical protein